MLAGEQNRVTLSAGASSTSVFTQNNLTFSVLPPASSYLTNALRGVLAAAVVPSRRTHAEQRPPHGRVRQRQALPAGGRLGIVA